MNLRGERVVRIRPIRADDLPRVEAMHGRLSRQTLHQRYFAATAPGRRELERLCRMAGREGTAYVATGADGRIVAIACYAQHPSCWGELAILIEDGYQGLGLGRKLFRLLVRHAAVKGLQTLELNILPSNRAMLHLARNSGRSHRERYRDGMQQIELSLAANH
jgi:RimJ/RimL family protein N-acetyltransferase